MILICAATEKEMQACLDPLGLAFPSLPVSPAGPWARRHGNLWLAHTGPGVPLTMARLMPLAASLRPELIVNIGIAGAYAGAALAIGDLVAGESEVFGDLGVEVPGAEAFRPISDFPWSDPIYRAPLSLSCEPWLGTASLRRGRGCTVNTCTGSAATGSLRRARFQVDFESMEGAAAALAGSELGIPVAELRAISNIAAEREMRPEYFATALRALGEFLGAWIGRNQ